MTDIGKITQAHYSQNQEQQKETCCNCDDCQKERETVQSADLNMAPNAVIGQSMVKGPYKFDPKKVEADVLAFKGKVDSMRENQKFVKEFKKELQKEHEESGKSPEEAEYLADIAAQCLSNPVVYNR